MAIDREWLRQQALAEPDEDQLKQARWLLGNCVHYRHGCASEQADIEMVAKGLVASAYLADNEGG